MVISWVIVTAAVLLLRVGMALYFTGLSRSKNAVASIFRSIAEIAVSLLAFCALGDLIGVGRWNELVNPSDTYIGFLAAAFLIGPAVVAGATMERSQILVNILAAILLPGIICPMALRLVDGPWLANHGFIDLAGATFIHFPAGVAAAVAAVAVGARRGKYNRDGSTNVIVGHHLPMVCSGVLVMLAMWLPYVAGFDFSQAPRSAFNVLVCVSAAVVASMAFCKLRFGRFDVLLVLSGLLGGLVSITAGAAALSPASATVTGAIAGILIPYATIKLDLLWKIDDPTGAICIHGLGGLWSAIAAAILAAGTFHERLDRLAVEVLGVALIGVISLVLASSAFVAAKLFVGLRCKEADETDGLDLAELDINAYPDFQQTTIKSYHLREM